MALRVRKKRGKNTLLHSSDRGGFDSIEGLVRAGIIIPDELGHNDDPWVWLNNAAIGKSLDDSIGCVAFDSGSSIGEIIISACANSSFQIGQQKAQRFAVNQGNDKLTISSASESHFGITQGFVLEAIRNSTWLTRRGIDVLWTFGEYRSEEQNRTPIIGPKMPGKALTAFLPKEFKRVFHLVSVPQEGAEPLHRMYLSGHPELAGLGFAYANSRYPLKAITPLPPYLEPSDIALALDLIERGQAEADEQIASELESI